MLQKLLRKARKGTKIIYIPGNHDEFLRNFLGLKFGGVKIVDRVVHTTVDGTPLPRPARGPVRHGGAPRGLARLGRRRAV